MEKILKGEYDLSYIPSETAVHNVIDCGGNIGAFTYWASHRWPAATIHAYEPDPLNCERFKRHLEDSAIPAWRYKLVQAAVVSSADPLVKIYRSKINCGMNSIRHGLAGVGAEPFDAPTFNPRDLPTADVLKVDTEGCEIDIIENYLKSHEPPQLISFEFHSWKERLYLEELLKPNYTLGSGEIVHLNLGTFNYVLNDCLIHTGLDQ